MSIVRHHPRRQAQQNRGHCGAVPEKWETLPDPCWAESGPVFLLALLITGLLCWGLEKKHLPPSPFTGRPALLPGVICTSAYQYLGDKSCSPSPGSRLAMHRVSAFLPSWDRSRPQPDPAPRAAGALEKVFGWAEKIVVPVNRTSAPPTAPPARYGRETYWPTTLDKECDKAARIIKSFCCTWPWLRPWAVRAC